MQFAREVRVRSLFLAVTLLCAFSSAGCGKKADPSIIGTFRMGERVQIGTMVYTILEAHYQASLVDGGAGKPPKNRYLFIRLSATNSGGNVAGIPPLTLIGPKQESYMEVTEGLEDVPNHFGMLRMIQPAETEQGVVVFDAPIAAYKLMISDGGEPGQEKFVRVELPVTLE